MVSAFTTLFVLVAGSAGTGACDSVSEALADTLAGHANVLAAQQALSETLGWSAKSASGVVASGRRVRVDDIDAEELTRELERPVPVLHYFEVNGEGPDPLKISVPVGEDTGEIEVHRRLEEGVFLRSAQPVERVGGYARFEAKWPGRFVVREVDAESIVDSRGFFVIDDGASLNPLLRVNWKLAPIAPEVISGPVPLVLVHGAETNRWGDFLHWAQYSPEAEAFRARYQVWDFNHELPGINAAVGYDPNCPYFEDSLAATLDRFMTAAMTTGVEADGAVWYFPSTPYAMMGHSHGTLKIRAFLVNFPEQAARCFAVMSIAGDNNGSPWATPEWVRQTVSRISLAPIPLLDLLLSIGYSDYFGIDIQSNVDAGWANLDARGGGGIPYLRYTTWTEADGLMPRWLSPRDAALSNARVLPDFPEDNDFFPAEPLPNACGGIDQITPARRGGRYADLFYLYAGYIEPGKGWREILFESDNGTRSAVGNIGESIGLRAANLLFGVVLSADADWPMGDYQMSDGFVPLQSQLFLDGEETEPVFETESIFGWPYPAWPLRPNMKVIHAHTLASPEKIRILPGWSHLDTVTGRYDAQTGHSTLFNMIVEDLLAAAP